MTRRNTATFTIGWNGPNPGYDLSDLAHMVMFGDDDAKVIDMICKVQRDDTY